MSFQVTDPPPVCGEEAEAQRRFLFGSHPGKWGGGSAPDPAPNSHGFKVTLWPGSGHGPQGAPGWFGRHIPDGSWEREMKAQARAAVGTRGLGGRSPYAPRSPPGADSVATGSVFPPLPPGTSLWTSRGQPAPSDIRQDRAGQEALTGTPAAIRGVNTPRGFSSQGSPQPQEGQPPPPGLCPDGRTSRTQVSVHTARPTLTHTCVNSASWSPAKPGVYSVCGLFPPQLQVRVSTRIIWPEAVKIYYRAHAIASVIKSLESDEF